MIDWDANLLEPLAQTFGESVNYRPQRGDDYDIEGVFDRAYTRDVETLEGDIVINTTKPVLGVRDIEFRSPPQQGDRLYIPRVGALFVVKDIHPDSHGGTRLELNEVK